MKKAARVIKNTSESRGFCPKIYVFIPTQRNKTCEFVFTGATCHSLSLVTVGTQTHSVCIHFTCTWDTEHSKYYR